MEIRSCALRRTAHQAALDSEPAEVSRSHGSIRTSYVILIFPHFKQNTSCVCISDENKSRSPKIDGRPGHQLCHGKYALISASQRVLPPSPFLGQLLKFASRRHHVALCPWTRCGFMFLLLSKSRACFHSVFEHKPTCVALTGVTGTRLEFSQRLHRQQMTPGSVGSVEVSKFRK